MSQKPRCPKCYSRRTIRAGKAIRIGGLVQRYQCQKCGRTWTTKPAA